MISNRKIKVTSWAKLFFKDNFEIVDIKSDAGKRKYYRLVFNDSKSFILVDSPPLTEKNKEFLQIHKILKKANLNVPKILFKDLINGFFIISDLGQKTFLDVITKKNAHEMFSDAIDALIKIQLSKDSKNLLKYDAKLLMYELNLFEKYFLNIHKKIVLSLSEKKELTKMFDILIIKILSQGETFVHRDYMPRNLIVSTPNPGIIDFQDALIGPVTYDVASLFKDAFISWNETEIVSWLKIYWQKAKKNSIPVNSKFEKFIDDYNMMTVQRHIKVIGIFARLKYRDNKDKYIKDIPRFINYLYANCYKYKFLEPLTKIMSRINES